MTTPQTAKGTKEDHWRDFWTRETGTGQHVAKLLDSYMMMMMMNLMIFWVPVLKKGSSKCLTNSHSTVPSHICIRIYRYCRNGHNAPKAIGYCLLVHVRRGFVYNETNRFVPVKAQQRLLESAYFRNFTLKQR
jgi:hypothetical protein